MAQHWLASAPAGDLGPRAATVDTSVAHIARVYDYWLGGKDNFAADREAAERVIAAYPDIVRSCQANRAFLVRTVRYLVREAGVRQFLDIGTGIPPPTTPMRWPSARHRRPVSCTWTTIP